MHRLLASYITPKVITEGRNITVNCNGEILSQFIGMHDVEPNIRLKMEANRVIKGRLPKKRFDLMMLPDSIITEAHGESLLKKENILHSKIKKMKEISKKEEKRRDFIKKSKMAKRMISNGIKTKFISLALHLTANQINHIRAKISQKKNVIPQQKGANKKQENFF